MNLELKQALDEYYKTIKEIRPNYRTCYNSFLEYCNGIYSKCSLRELFERHITIFHIKQACKYYIEKSKKATSVEAVQRFLTSMDYFYRYLKENDIICESLEAGCRRKEIVHDICINLNNELKKKIYLPFDGKRERKILDKQIALLHNQNFFQLGQSIICRLLLTYGFKEKVVVNFKRQDFDSENGKLLINYNGENSISINLFQAINEQI